jgi:hypothetical protein
MSSADGRGAAPSGGKPSRARGLLYAGILLVVAGGLVTRWALDREVGTTWTEAPPETLGVWISADERYAGRAIEVTPLAVTLRLGDSDASAVAGGLRIAREQFDGAERVLRLEYVTSDGSDAIDMVIGPGGASMYLRNQPEVVWTRASATAPPPPVVPPIVAPEGPALLDPGLLSGMLVLALAAALLVLRRRATRTNAAADHPGGDEAGNAPAWLRGVWTTVDPKQKGRSVRIASHYSYENFGDDDVRIGGEIIGVRQRREGGSRVATVEYLTPAGVQEVEMTVDRDGLMRLGDGSRSVWERR